MSTLNTSRENRSRRVLVVDDEKATLEVCQAMLNQAGIEAVTAENTKQALEALTADQPVDLILLDNVMPGETGIHWLPKLKTLYPNIPVIMWSGHLASDGQQEAYKLGVARFLAKPMGIKDLLLEIKQAMETPSPTIPAGEHKNESKDCAGAPVQASRPDGVSEPTGLYPFVVGGLTHNAMNTLFSLQFYAEKLSNTEERATPEQSVAGTAKKIQLCVSHLGRTLSLIQGLSREYYAITNDKPLRQTERLRELVNQFSGTHPEIVYTASLDASFDDSALPFGVITFIVGELLENATRAFSPSGPGDVSFTVSVSKGDRMLSISCVDAGSGFSEDTLRLIRDKQLRAPRELGKGGYGLYLMNEIVQRLKGRILASNREPHGARIEIQLPWKEESK